MKFLFIILDDSSISLCNYESSITSNLMPIGYLKEAIIFAMKNNLSIHYLYPSHELPTSYVEVISKYTGIKIKPYPLSNGTDILVVDSIDNLFAINDFKKVVVLRISKEILFKSTTKITKFANRGGRLNVMILDVDLFSSDDFDKYKKFLAKIRRTINCESNLNILTDRIYLDNMNNCNAGVESITLAPNGSFYVCPAFYYSNPEDCIGSLKEGIKIKNKYLYKIEYAPICRQCDAFQCKRCVWLNKKTTLEINTPSHEQCVVAHIERNASRQLLLSKKGKAYHKFNGRIIPKIDYLDPFENRDLWTKY